MRVFCTHDFRHRAPGMTPASRAFFEPKGSITHELRNLVAQFEGELPGSPRGNLGERRGERRATRWGLSWPALTHVRAPAPRLGSGRLPHLMQGNEPVQRRGGCLGSGHMSFMSRDIGLS